MSRHHHHHHGRGRSPFTNGTNGDDSITGSNRSDIIRAKNGDDSIDAGGGNDLIDAGRGDDMVEAGWGHDRVFAGRGDDVVDGGHGNDYIDGGKGDDQLYGSAGYDRIKGGSGNDTVDGGEGSDWVDAGRGDDLLVFTAGHGGCGWDFYEGGRGIDTLHINLTAAQWADAAINAQILSFLDYLETAHTNHRGEVTGCWFFMPALDLAVREVEDLVIYVDGVLVDPSDPGTTLDAVDDAFDVAEDAAFAGNVLDNDTATGASANLISGPPEGTLVLNADGSFTYDPEGAFEALAQGETTTVSFTYELSDGTDTDTATVTLTIQGANDTPVVSGILSATLGEDDAAYSMDLLAGASDVDNGAVLSVANVSALPSGVTLSGSTLNVDLSDPAFQALALGATEVITVTFDVVDEFGAAVPQTATIEVVGANDAPTVAAALSETVGEGATAVVTLDLLAGASDVDNGAVLSIANLSALPAGVTLSGSVLTIDGSDPAYEHLAEGATETLTLGYEVVDEHYGAVRQTATITIIGTNDAPTVAAALSAAAAEDDAAFTLDLLDGASDVDDGAVLSVANVSALPSGVTLSGSTLNVDPSNAGFQHLAEGATEVLTVTFDVVDEFGAAAPQTATITVTGTNDAPTVAAALSASGTEDGAPVTLDLLDGASDVDDGAVLSVANVSTLPAGVTLSGSTLSVDPSDASFQHLNLGDTEVITVTYDVVDEHGATVPQTASITITGTNDGPVEVSAIDLSSADSAADYTVDLLTGVTDIDDGAVLSVSSINLLSGDASGVTIAGDQLTISPGAYDFLDAGEDEVLTFSVVVVDEHGASVTRTATITVTGTGSSNSAPVVSGPVTSTAAEGDAPYTLDLLAGASDPDAGAVLSIANLSALPAGFTVSGSTLSVDPSDASFDHLAVGASEVVTLSYDVVDEFGASVAQTATITVTGTNDAPTVAAALSLSAVEDAAIATLDLLAGASDVDDGAVLSIANVSALPDGVTISGSTLSVDPSDPAFQHLALGDIEVLTVTYDVVDEHGAATPQTAYIDITGTNDAPTVSAALVDGTDEGTLLSVDLLAGASDVDDGAVLTVTGLVQDSGPTLPVTHSGGIMSFDATSLDYLNEGDTEVFTYSYTINDEHGATVPQTVTITVTGTNDAPTVAAALSASAAEDDAAFTLDLLDGASDVDDGAVLSVVNVSALPAGVTLSGSTLTVDPADAAFQHLNVGEIEVITVTYDVADEHGATAPQTATITVTGTNDAPTVALGLSLTVDEDGPVTSLDLLSGASDVDDGAVLSVANVSALPPGVTLSGSTLTIDPSDPSMQPLAAGVEGTALITFDIVDEHGASVPQTVLITINGQNDAPEVLRAITSETNEDDAAYTLNLLDAATDIDFGDVLSVTNVGPLPDGLSLVGSILTVDPSDASLQDLALGETRVLSVSYDVEDGNGGVLPLTAQITVTGTNDAPTVAAALSASAAEDDAAFTLDLLDGASDVDNGAVLSVANVSGLPDWVTLSGSSLTIDPGNSAYQHLNVGASEVITVTYDVVDEHGASVPQTATITITGTNDAPTVSAAITGTTDEDASWAVNLLDYANDVDDGAVLTFSGVTQTSGRSADIVLMGNFLNIDPTTFQDMDEGDTEVLTLTYTVSDEHGASTTNTVTLTVTGSNDAPTIAYPLSAAADEDFAAFTLDLLDGADDVDADAVLSIANVSALPAGVTLVGRTLTVDPADASFQHLNVGATEVIIVTYDVVDELGASVPQTATITITGTNDAPTVAAALTASAAEDDVAFTMDLLTGASDVDDGAVLGIANVSALPAGVTLSGSTLTVDPADATFQHLNVGMTEVITVTFDVVDEHGEPAPQTATITITGTNDAPTVAAALTDATDEDTPISVDLLDGASDVDDGAVLSVSGLAQTAGRPVAFALTGTSLDFDPTAFQEMDDGETEDFTFTYMVEDEHGAQTPQSVTITVAGVNDAPVAENIVITTNEDAAAISTDLLGTASDVDTHDVLSALNVVQTAGRAVVPILSGSTITIDPAPFQDLALGESETVSFDYEITDGDETITNTVDFIIEGRNDSPVVNASVDLQVALTGAGYSFALPAGIITDVDATDVLTWEATQADGNPRPAWLNFDAATQTFSGTPASGDTGLLHLEVTATDPHGESASFTFWLAAVDGTLIGTPDKDDLDGASPAIVELVRGLEQNDELTGLDDSDIYVLEEGGGFDLIDDNGYSDTDVLFLNGISAGEVEFSLWPTGREDLLIRYGSGEDAVVVLNTLNESAGDEIEQVVLGDGTVYTMADIRDIIQDAMQTSGNDTVEGLGTTQPETLEGGLGDDLMSGYDGDDLYIFNAGDGRDVIDDNGYADNDRLEVRGYSSTDAVFSLIEGTSADVLIDLPGRDQVVLRGSLLESNADEIEEIFFDGDGVTVTMADLRLLFIQQQQTSGDDDINGFSVNPNEVFEGGLGNDNIQGLDGSDTYIFNAGDGVDRIEDNGYADTDVLDIRGYSSTDAVFTRVPGTLTHLLITLPGGDEITLVNTLDENNNDEIEEIHFDGDGVILTMADVRALIQAGLETSGDDIVQTWNFDETVTGGLGDDYLIGADGSDTYVFNAGDGRDRISDGGYTDTDVLQINGYSSTDAVIRLAPNTSADLLIELPGDDEIRIINTLTENNVNEIEEIRFSGDGAILTMADLRTQIINQMGTAGNDELRGFSGGFDETLTGGLGDDYLVGGDGSDTYVFNAGDGRDTISDGGYADTDVLMINGYSSTDAMIEQDFGEYGTLTINLPGGDAITIVSGALNSNTYNIEQIVFSGDGVTWTPADVQAGLLAAQQSAGDDVFSGINVAQTIEAGTGNDRVSGGSQLDSYIYNAGDGYDAYIDNSTGNAITVNGYSSTDLVAVRTDTTTNAYILQLDFGNGDRITLADHRRFEVTFAGDGVFWDAATLATQAAAGIDLGLVTGTNSGETFVLTGETEVRGLNGSDTYQFAAGTGYVRIEESGSATYTDRLEITGYSSTDMSVGYAPYAVGSSALLLDFGNGDLIELEDELSNSSAFNSVDEVWFAGDGVTLSLADLMALYIDGQTTAGNDTVRGSTLGDTLEGGQGDDTLSGYGGSDFYIFNAGDGDDRIEDNGTSETDELEIRGYASTDAIFERAMDDADTLLIILPGGDRVRLVNSLDGAYGDHIETVTFDGDGVSLTMADIRAIIFANSQTAGNDFVEGSSVSDTLEAGLGQDTMTGYGASDLYIYNAGDGSDEIEDNGNADVDVLEIRGYLSTDASYALVTGDADDLRIDFGGGDSVLLRNTLEDSYADAIEQIYFADDTVTLTMADLRAHLVAQQQSAGDDSVYGFALNDTLEGGLGVDYLSGGNGSDTYVFNAGDGQDRIDDNGSADTDVLLINGYSSTDASFSYGPGSNADLIISFAGGDRVFVVNTLQESYTDAIETVTFDGDAVSLSMADIRAILFAQSQTPGNDTVDGSSLADTLDGGLGDDVLSGGNGSDLYLYSYGDGNDTINDQGSADADVLRIDGVLSTDVTINAEPGASNNLVLNFANGQSIVIENTVDGNYTDAIETIEFVDDGDSWDMQEVRDTLLAQNSTSGDDTIDAFAFDETLTGGTGDDLIYGRNGSDVYVFNVGDGDDIVYDLGSADTDALLFNGLNSTDVSFERMTLNSTDLLIRYGSGDSVTVLNTLGSSTYTNGIEEFRFDDTTLTLADVLLLV